MTKIVSWNVNGIRAIERKKAMDPVMAKLDPDILCLQEVKATEDQPKLAFAEGYHVAWNAADKAGYSGTALLSKIKPIDVKYNFPSQIEDAYDLEDSYGHPNTEGRIIVAEFPQYFVATVYTPHAKDDLSRVPLRHHGWDAAFLEYMKQLETTKPVIFNGDLNVAHTEADLARPDANKGKKGFTAEEREGFQNYIDAGFVDTFRLFTKGDGHYSWWTYRGGARKRNVGWRIDYVIVSSILADQVKKAEIHDDIMGSDHCPVSITLA